MERDTCECGRVLQNNSMAEMTGLCDHCRDELRDTKLALREQLSRATDPDAKRSFRERLARLITSPDIDDCECAICVERWEELG